MPIKCFIFDLDGTLVFNEQANFLAYKKAFEAVSLNLTEQDFAHHFASGGNIEEIYSDFMNKNKLQPDSSQLAAIKKVKSKEYANQFHLIEKNEPIIDLLEALSKHYHTALATTASTKNGKAVIDNFGLTELFDLMVFREDVAKPKPDPECHHKIAKHFGVKPEECLIFEDSSKGFAAAEAFGAHICKVIE